MGRSKSGDRFKRCLATEIGELDLMGARIGL